MKTFKALILFFCIVTILFCNNVIINAQEYKDSTSTTENYPDPNALIKVEKLPTMVYSRKIIYPEEAKQANITGKVYVKVLVDKNGKAIKAFVIKSDSELFNKSAVDAAMQSQFTPALNKGIPIAVWIVLPYKYDLDNTNNDNDYAKAGPQIFDNVELAKENFNGLISAGLKKADTDGWKYEKIEGKVSFGDESVLYKVIDKDKTFFGFVARDGVNIYKYKTGNLDDMQKFVEYIKKK
jgi:TonB family protein